VAGGSAFDGHTQDIATSTDPAHNVWSVGTVTLPGAVARAITAVSCPSVNLCVAVDDNGHVLTSSNPAGGASTWAARYVLDAKGGPDTPAAFTSLSCTGSVCVALDFHDVLTTSDPASGNWTATPDYPGGGGLASISCWGGGACVAAGGSTVFYTDDPHKSWDQWAYTTLVPIKNGAYDGRLVGVSCTSSLCVVTDNGSANTPPGTWSTSSPTGNSVWTRVANSNMTGMSCVSDTTNLCAGWNSFGRFVTASSNPTGPSSDWVPTQDVSGPDGVNPNIYGLSCALRPSRLPRCVRR
jgi:hypothetical protein